MGLFRAIAMSFKDISASWYEAEVVTYAKHALGVEFKRYYTDNGTDVFLYQLIEAHKQCGHTAEFAATSIALYVAEIEKNNET